MSKLKNIDPEKLISMLRCEIGELIQGLIVLRLFDAKAFSLQSDDLQKDIENQELNVVNLIRTKFKDDIILRLSELASTTHGTVNFSFAYTKLKMNDDDLKKYKTYLETKHIIFRRNKNIAHKQISSNWGDIDPRPYISNFTITKSISWAISLMKQIDKTWLGEDYKVLWKIEKKQRYELKMPATPKYMLLPYIAKIT